VTDLVRSHLDFTLKPEQAEALFEIVRKHPVIEWNEQLKDCSGSSLETTPASAGPGQPTPRIRR